MTNEVGARIESEIEIKSYIQNLKYALNNGAKINFQELKRELLTLSVDHYMRTV